jgi:hypothetical protein
MTDRRFAADDLDSVWLRILPAGVFPLTAGAECLALPSGSPTTTGGGTVFAQEMHPGKYWIVAQADAHGMAGNFILQVASTASFKVTPRTKLECWRTVSGKAWVNEPWGNPGARAHTHSASTTGTQPLT